MFLQYLEDVFMIEQLGNEQWKKLVLLVRNEVVNQFPEISNSIDFGAYISPNDYFVSYIFMTTHQLEAAKESGLLEQICLCHKSTMEKYGYPIDAIKDCSFASQEDCEKMCGGNWFYYYK